jgi:hypothetical protein
MHTHLVDSRCVPAHLWPAPTTTALATTKTTMSHESDESFEPEDGEIVEGVPKKAMARKAKAAEAEKARAAKARDQGEGACENEDAYVGRPVEGRAAEGLG